LRGLWTTAGLGFPGRVIVAPRRDFPRRSACCTCQRSTRVSPGPSPASRLRRRQPPATLCRVPRRTDRSPCGGDVRAQDVDDGVDDCVEDAKSRTSRAHSGMIGHIQPAVDSMNREDARSGC
jgi:hypothetical protein